MKLAKAIRQFLEDAELAQGLSSRTIENYQHYLNRFADFSGAIKVGAIDDALVRNYRLWLNDSTAPESKLKDRSSKDLSKATQNYHLVALRAMLGWLARKDIKSLSPSKVDLPGADEADVTFLDAKTVSKLLAAPQTKTRGGKRDKALLKTLFSTGLRVAELVKLDRKTVENKDEVSVVGKGKKRRVVFISDSAKAAIADYLAERVDNDKALFVREWKGDTQKGGRLTARSIQRLIKRYAAETGVADNVTPHTLRHTFATDLLQSGADLRAVQALLGHSSVVTTQRYTHLTDQHLKDVHQAFHGRRTRRSRGNEGPKPGSVRSRRKKSTD